MTKESSAPPELEEVIKVKLEHLVKAERGVSASYEGIL